VLCTPCQSSRRLTQQGYRMSNRIEVIVGIVVLGAVVYGAIAQQGSTERARIEGQTQRAVAVVFAGKATTADVNFQTRTSRSLKEEIPASSPALTELAKSASVSVRATNAKPAAPPT
jgi:hypothetical protein